MVRIAAIPQFRFGEYTQQAKLTVVSIACGEIGANLVVL